MFIIYYTDLFILRVVYSKDPACKTRRYIFHHSGTSYVLIRDLPKPPSASPDNFFYFEVSNNLSVCLPLFLPNISFFLCLSRRTNNLSVCPPYFWVIIFFFVNLIPHQELNQRLLSGSWSTTPKHTGTT